LANALPIIREVQATGHTSYDATANGAAGHSVLPRIDEEGDDSLFAKRLGGL
jgi:hypothetical protein